MKCRTNEIAQRVIGGCIYYLSGMVIFKDNPTTLLAKIDWPHGNELIENQRKYSVTSCFKKLTYW